MEQVVLRWASLIVNAAIGYQNDEISSCPVAFEIDVAVYALSMFL